MRDPGVVNLVDGLVKQAKTCPDKILASGSNHVLTYGQCLAMAFCIATGLRQRLKPGTRVGVLVPNHPLIVPVIYGVLAADCVVVPLNYLLQPHEQERALAQAEIGLILGVSELMATFSLGTYECPVVAVTEFLAAGTKPELSPCMRGAKDAAVLLYTSGTSSASLKVVELSHAALIANVHGCQQVFGFGPTDKFLSVLPYFHCFALTVNLFLPVHCGGEVQMLVRFKPQDVMELLRQNAVTIAAMIPAMYKVFLQIAPQKELIQSVRLYISGGEALGRATADKMWANYGVCIAEGYGMTEAGPVLSVNHTMDQSLFGTVGHAIPGVELTVLDANGQVLDNGQTGEVCFRSPGMMNGYLNLEDPFEGRLRNGWFHTGDLGSLRPDGVLTLEGRIKDLIISAGENISPREIEEAALHFIGVAEACAFGLESDLRGEEPALALAPQGLNMDDLRRHLRTELAAYKVPRHIVCFPELPKSPTGKVLRRMVKAQVLELRAGVGRETV